MPRMDMADGAQEIASKSRHRPAPQEIAPAIVRRPRWKSALTPFPKVTDEDSERLDQARCGHFCLGIIVDHPVS
jgi:hypothetical protein